MANMEEKRPEEATSMEPQAEAPKPSEMPSKPSTTTVVIQSPVVSSSMFTKSHPNDLYRRLLPAVLFVLTFVTVMTMLLIYMDTVALGAAQFRLNMSRDHELSDIGAESSELVSYVRQLHLRETPPATEAPTAESVSKTPTVDVLDTVFTPDLVGRFVVVVGSGSRGATSLYLERARGWSGLEVRADPRSYLALAGRVAALHACLSHTTHPREVSVRGEAGFVGRVLCLPLVTILRAGGLTSADYLLLRGHDGLTALQHLPFHNTPLKVIELESSDASILNATTALLTAHNYTLLDKLEHSNIYKLTYV